MLRLISLISLLFVFLVPNLHAKSSLKKIEIAVGEYKPFVSEFVEGYGELTEKVTAILKRMGYKPVYVFMPWGQAVKKVKSNQINEGLRGTFPFIKTDAREGDFLYPEKPLRKACLSFFYNKEKIFRNHPEFRESLTPNPQEVLKTYPEFLESNVVNVSLEFLKSLEGPQSLRFGAIRSGKGYKYPETLKEILPEQQQDADTSQPNAQEFINNIFKNLKSLIQTILPKSESPSKENPKSETDSPKKKNKDVSIREKKLFNDAYELFNALIDPTYEMVEAIPFEKRVGMEILYDLFPDKNHKVRIMKNKNPENKNDAESSLCFAEEKTFFIVSRKKSGQRGVY